MLQFFFVRINKEKGKREEIESFEFRIDGIIVKAKNVKFDEYVNL